MASLFEGEPHETRDLAAQIQWDASLAVALRSLQELSDEDKAQVISIIQRFVASSKSLQNEGKQMQEANAY